LAVLLPARAFRRRIKSENEELRSHINHNVSKREMGIVLLYDDDDSCDNITIDKYTSFDSFESKRMREEILNSDRLRQFKFENWQTNTMGK